jgi:hypothetical protein
MQLGVSPQEEGWKQPWWLLTSFDVASNYVAEKEVNLLQTCCCSRSESKIGVAKKKIWRVQCGEGEENSQVCTQPHEKMWEGFKGGYEWFCTNAYVSCQIRFSVQFLKGSCTCTTRIWNIHPQALQGGVQLYRRCNLWRRTCY